MGRVRLLTCALILACYVPLLSEAWPKLIGMRARTPTSRESAAPRSGTEQYSSRVSRRRASRQNRAFQSFTHTHGSGGIELPNSFYKGLANKGSPCATAYKESERLCALHSEKNRMTLSALLANCHLQAINGPQINYNERDGLKYATETQQLIVMQLLPYTPKICARVGHDWMYLLLESERKSSLSNENQLKEMFDMLNDVRAENEETRKLMEELDKISIEAEKQVRTLVTQTEELYKAGAEITKTADLFDNYTVIMDQRVNFITNFSAESEKRMNEDIKLVNRLLTETQTLAEKIANREIGFGKGNTSPPSGLSAPGILILVLFNVIPPGRVYMKFFLGAVITGFQFVEFKKLFPLSKLSYLPSIARAIIGFNFAFRDKSYGLKSAVTAFGVFTLLVFLPFYLVSRSSRSTLDSDKMDRVSKLLALLEEALREAEKISRMRQGIATPSNMSGKNIITGTSSQIQSSRSAGRHFAGRGVSSAANHIPEVSRSWAITNEQNRSAAILTPRDKKNFPIPTPKSAKARPNTPSSSLASENLSTPLRLSVKGRTPSKKGARRKSLSKEARTKSIERTKAIVEKEQGPFRVHEAGDSSRQSTPPQPTHSKGHLNPSPNTHSRTPDPRRRDSSGSYNLRSRET